MTHLRPHAPIAVAPIFMIASLGLLAACNKAAAPAPEATGERVATVNGKALPKSAFDLYVANMSPQSGREMAEQKDQLLDRGQLDVDPLWCPHWTVPRLASQALADVAAGVTDPVVVQSQSRSHR